jgi:hypothetical protein
MPESLKSAPRSKKFNPAVTRNALKPSASGSRSFWQATVHWSMNLATNNIHLKRIRKVASRRNCTLWDEISALGTVRISASTRQTQFSVGLDDNCSK